MLLLRYSAYISNKRKILLKIEYSLENTNYYIRLMSHPFPTISDQKRVQIWAITPDASALEQLANGIWHCAAQTGQRPLVVLSTAGPLIGVRKALEKYRPDHQPKNIAFLPQVMSFTDWLEAAPGAWKFPRKQSDLERWLSVYSTLRNHSDLQAWFKAETESGAWGLAKAIVQACDTLSKTISPQLQTQLRERMTQDPSDWINFAEQSQAQAQQLLDSTIAQAYSGMARKVVDQEAKVLLTFWRYTASVGDPVFRNQFAMAAHLDAMANNHASARPLIWVETADPAPIDQEIIGQFLGEYAQYAPAIEAKMDWREVGLWPEAIGTSDAQAIAVTNVKRAYSRQWRLISAKRFEELAWATAKSVEQHLINGKTNVALVAQDRLVARRARALLARLGPALNIRDETGWKLSTTRAAAALNSWLELIRAPKDGPSAKVVLEFLQNPFLDLGKILKRDAASCVGLVAELEDILVASKAESGWKTFHLAIEGAQERAVKAGSKGSKGPSMALFELLQFVRERHHEWLTLKVECKKAYDLLHNNLQHTGMEQGLEQDSAGKQLLEVLKTFDLSKTPYQDVPIRLSEWLSLLKTVIEEASYQEEGKTAQATLTILPLSSTRLRDFDAVVVVGCDEQQLPAYSEPPLFFSDALNQLFKSSTMAMQFVQQAKDLSQLLVSCAHVDLLWQSKSNNGEPLRPSAWIQRLQNQIAWEVMPTQLDKRRFDIEPMAMAVAHFEEALPMPLSMSPSAYKALRDCPYRYYVRSLLGLRKNKEFDDGFDASLAGQTLHKLLKRFYHALKTHEHTNPAIKTDPNQRRTWMEKNLSLYSEQEFAKLIEGDARVMGALRDWQKQIPSFIDWQLQREHAGWEYFDGEVHVGFDLPFRDGEGKCNTIRIEGFADRYDVQVANAKVASVIDYKNQRFERVKERAERVLDDPQLLIYARAANEDQESHRLAGHRVQQAEWVALKADLSKGEQNAMRAKEVGDIPVLLEQFTAQITEDVEQLWAKKPMHAFAPEGVCQYCEARGICRKGTW